MTTTLTEQQLTFTFAEGVAVDFVCLDGEHVGRERLEQTLYEPFEDPRCRWIGHRPYGE